MNYGRKLMLASIVKIYLKGKRFGSSITCNVKLSIKFTKKSFKPGDELNKRKH